MIYSKYARNLLVDAAFRGGTITFPATYYIALLSSAPTVNDVYTEIGNTIPNGYARKSVVSNATNWAATNGVGTTDSPSTGTTAITSNNIALVYANPTGDWIRDASPTATPITHVGFFDSATIGAGNLWFYVPITPKTIEAYHTSPTIPIGGLTITLDR